MCLRIQVWSSGLHLCAFLCLLCFGCASVPKYPAQGSVAGQAITTTVDSELSQYYLEHYLRNDRINPPYDQEIDRVLTIWSQRPLNSNSLRELTQESSPDFATLYFIARVYGDAINRKAQDAFQGYVAALRAKGPQEIFRIAKRSAPYLIAFVPGYAYKKDPATGADFAQQRRVMTEAGVKNVLIETDELATVDKNARIIASEILRLNAEHPRIILVSSSKGGTEVALAIGKLLPPERLRGVKAWVSIGGLLRGTPSADQALRWPKSWLVRVAFFFTGHRGEIIEDLNTRKRREVFAQLEFPGHMLTLQYVGAPLSGQIAEYAQGRYDDLKNLGPNDGLTLLADELIDGGVVITDIGLDHYYLDPDIDLKTFALASVILDLLEGHDRQAGHSRPATSP